MPNKIFVLGVWDMLHVGHLRLINTAAELGDLTVGIVCDTAVRKQKGNDRPIISDIHRHEMISNLKGVKQVVYVGDFEIPIGVLQFYDIIVIGQDQQHINNLDSIPATKRYDVERTEGVSTSDIIAKIKGQ